MCSGTVYCNCSFARSVEQGDAASWPTIHSISVTNSVIMTFINHEFYAKPWVVPWSTPSQTAALSGAAAIGTAHSMEPVPGSSAELRGSGRLWSQGKWAPDARRNSWAGGAGGTGGTGERCGACSGSCHAGGGDISEGAAGDAADELERGKAVVHEERMPTAAELSTEVMGEGTVVDPEAVLLG